MIDIHAHILPDIDDGSRNVKESIQLLESSLKQGITEIVATPHFYASRQSPEVFLRERENAYNLLRRALNDELPRVHLGAEIYYFEGMSKSEDLSLLSFSNAPVLLIEMPFRPWNSRMVREILQVQNLSGCQVVLAHIERYMEFSNGDYLKEMARNDVCLQSNAEFFVQRLSRHRVKKMIRSGLIQLIASDCHRIDTRPPRIGEAMARLDDEDAELLRENANKLFSAG